jgi:hypothetical protein
VNGWFEFERDKSVYVNHYYFYIDDADFGPLFFEICSYAPWSMKLCLNGHEWAKRQLEKRRSPMRLWITVSCRAPSRRNCRTCQTLSLRLETRGSNLPASPFSSFPFIVTEYLFVQVTEQMEWLDAYLRSVDAAFEGAPEILSPVPANV